MKKLTKEEFIKKAREVHGDKYNYSKVAYVNNSTKVCIICPEHGEFWQTPGNHLSGRGCNKCRYIELGKKHRMSVEEFVKRANILHDNKYNYSKIKYVNNNTKVCIICPEHGEFWQKPSVHLMGCGCQKCCKSGVKLTSEEFVKRAKEKHGNKYDYSKTEYKNAKEKVCIICPEHGEFWQLPDTHVNGKGCPKCIGRGLNQIEIIKRFKSVHGEKYDYSKVKYSNNNTKVCIICPKHGEFWQTPQKHLSGQGCPSCQKSVLEERMYKILKKYDINYETQKTFDWLRNPITNSNLYLDFYLPEYNIAIECQGKQHFLENCTFTNHGGETLETIQQRDKAKLEACLKHSVPIVYFSLSKIKFPYDVVTSEKEVIKIILEKSKSLC